MGTDITRSERQTREQHTVASERATQRDVPGLTRAALPVITNVDWMRGVKVLSVGVNGGSAPPAVPWNRPFLWRDEGTGSQIIAMWHPGARCRVECGQRKGCFPESPQGPGCVSNRWVCGRGAA